ncbi:MAG: DUF2071 domain-containing protein [Verrucomicrobia bacterium]|jgi:uncharacterized protein YqjF (DUF2071 family)|nr:DUF2071 domain-containing protein [Verrucomicrobiota bacterium]
MKTWARTAPTPEQRLAERDNPADGPVLLHMQWRDLLFLHWRVDPGLVQATLPDGLTVDCFDGAAWLGIVPFHMKGVRPRGCPAVPGLSAFLELNLRTYAVDRAGRPGVWFYTLETNDRVAVFMARTFFHLAYRFARLESRCDEEGTFHYTCRSRRAAAWLPEQAFSWRPAGKVSTPLPGSLAFFLLERYRLFTSPDRRGRLHTGQVRHSPYPVQEAEAGRYSTRLFSLHGFAEPEGPPDAVHASTGVDVAAHSLQGLGTG